MFDLQNLTGLITETFAFTGKKYPELAGADPDEIRAFAIRHSALHFAKVAGRIAAHAEASDHGAELDPSELEVDIAKSLINTLRLAELVGMNAERLDQLVRDLAHRPISDQ